MVSSSKRHHHQTGLNAKYVDINAKEDIITKEALSPMSSQNEPHHSSSSLPKRLHQQMGLFTKIGIDAKEDIIYQEASPSKRHHGQTVIKNRTHQQISINSKEDIITKETSSQMISLQNPKMGIISSQINSQKSLTAKAALSQTRHHR